MKRVNLGKDEKTVLRMVAGGQGVCPSEYPLHTFNASVRSLESKGLVRGAYEEGGNVADARMTWYGGLYMAENPNLRNPVNRGMIAALIVAVCAIVISLLVACNG